MRIVYHLGGHCTDEERLIRCLLKNRASLAEAGILVPSPTRYRKLMRDTAVELKGAAASPEREAELLASVLGASPGPAKRVILSWDSFLAFPQWALRTRLYDFAGERIRAFTRIFPGHEAEFHLALRNPATLLPALYERQRESRSYADFIGEADPADLRWSDVVTQIRAQNPEVPLTLWPDEETPLIQDAVLSALSGLEDVGGLSDTDELFALIMAPEGLMRMRRYLASHPPASALQRRKITLAFLEKFALPERLETAFSLPGWDAALVDQMSRNYSADLDRIAALPGVRLIRA